MKRYISIGFLVFVLVSIGCKAPKVEESKLFSSVKIDILLQDSLLNCRALEVYNSGAAFATSSGKYGVVLKEIPRKEGAVDPILMATYIDSIKYDTIIPHFRAIAMNNNHLFALSVGSPALLFKIGQMKEVELVYREDHEKVFYDSMAFWNSKEGIAIGDPTDSCMSIIVTRDGGNSWQKIPCDELPKVKDGEAAFAASNSNISIVGDKTWVATGGKSSRILFSPDKGKRWEVFNTPVIQGKETTGLYSIDFYDELQGYGIGGDYTKPLQARANKIKTVDGGKTWSVVGFDKEPGYRSCVQYVPGSRGNSLVSIGYKGIDYSHDGGVSWTHLSDEGFYTIRFINEREALAAGKGKIAKFTFN